MRINCVIMSIYSLALQLENVHAAGVAQDLFVILSSQNSRPSSFFVQREMLHGWPIAEDDKLHLHIASVDCFQETQSQTEEQPEAMRMSGFV